MVQRRERCQKRETPDAIHALTPPRGSARECAGGRGSAGDRGVATLFRPLGNRIAECRERATAGAGGLAEIGGGCAIWCVFGGCWRGGRPGGNGRKRLYCAVRIEPGSPATGWRGRSAAWTRTCRGRVATMPAGAARRPRGASVGNRCLPLYPEWSVGRDVSEAKGVAVEPAQATRFRRSKNEPSIIDIRRVPGSGTA